MKWKIAPAAAVLTLVALIALRHLQSREPTAGPTPTAAAPSPVALSGRPRLPAPRVESASAPSAALPETTSSNVLLRVLHNQEDFKLSREQVDPYLAANRRGAASLLAAFRTTGDTNFLLEAMQNFPQDPMVDFAAVFKPGTTPEERRQWLETFKQSAPDNALANYLSALDCFKAGQNDQAVQELQAAYGKRNFQDYSLEFMQNSEEAYRSAGYGEAEAKALAFSQLLLPHLRDLKQTGLNVVELVNSYRQAGDEASAQAAREMGFNLARQLQNPGTFNPLINELVGIAIERKILDTLDPATPYGGAGQTVQGRLDEMIAYRKSIDSLVKQTGPLLETLPPPDLVGYFDRTKAFGELSAIQWLANKYGAQTR